MRNMKRVLSLVMAMVMLLGMLTIPTGAANNFTDADQIVNAEAVEITAGMGLFAGSDGKFNPQGTVTRAQMATIIVKMMYGSDFNADTFKGAGNPFPDTAGFEGGWAEGYINACFQMGVVKGYGDGTFKPGNQVTTAEAVTMIINALKVDAGEGEWPNTVMAKATELKLFGDLKPAPATNDVLVRDQLAVITLEGLKCSPSGGNTYSYTTPGGKTFEFSSLEDAMATVGVENADSITVNPADDTLAKKVYNLKIETGFVTDNQATGADYTEVNGLSLDVETGLDMIGHYVSVYYQVPKSGQSVDAYKVYSVVDESVVVTVSEDAENAKEYKAAFGRNYEPAESVLVFEGDYRISEATTITDSYTAGSIADAGTYVINENKVVAYLKPADQHASYISSVAEFDGEKQYMLGGEMKTLTEDEITVYAGAAKGDIVTYVKAKDQYVLSPADPVKGTITKTGKNTDGKDVLTLNGQEYVAFGATNNAAAGAELTIAVDAATFKYGEQYVVYLSQDNKVVGWKLTEGGATGDVDVSKIVYAKGAYSKTEKDAYAVKGTEITKHFLHAVDFEGNEVHLLLAQGDDVNMQGNYAGNDASYKEGFYVVKDYDGTYADAKKADIKLVYPVGLRQNLGDNGEGAYDEETGLTYADDLFYGSNRWGSGLKMPAANSNNHICTDSCAGLGGGKENHSYSDDSDADFNTVRTFFNDDTAFLMVEGDLAMPLKCAAGDEDFSYTNNATFFLSMLYTEDDSGLVDVVMVVIPKSPDEVTVVNPVIYVTGKSAGSSALGDVYYAYTAKAAEPMDVVVRPNTEVTKGFKEFFVDEDGWYTLNPTTVGAAYENMVIQSITSNGLINAIDPNYDEATATEKMNTPSGANASKAKIVDLRDDDNIKNSGVGELTNLEQLRTLIENGYVINADIYSSETSVQVIYVTSTYKTDKSTVYYVTAKGKAGEPLPAYNTKTGALENVVVTDEYNNVLGFATIVSATSHSTKLAPVEGDNYVDKDVIKTVVKDGDNMVVTERSEAGRSVTVTPTTVFGKNAFGITSPATLKAKYDALSGEAYTCSYITDGEGNATFFVVVDRGDPDVADGNLIKTTAKLTATTEPDVVEEAWKVTGNLAGEKHAVRYVAVEYPEGVDFDKLADTKEFYYTANKDGSDITLTFAYNLAPKSGDVIFVPDTVTAGDVVVGYSMGRADVDPEDVVYVQTGSDSTYQTATALAAGGPKNTRGRFWTVDETGKMGGVRGITSGQTNGNDYKIIYHDTIVGFANGELTLTNADGHTGMEAKCGWNFGASCESSGSREANKVQKVPENVPIIDLTGNNCNTVQDIIDLASNVIVNLYIPDGVKNEVGTVKAIVVQYPGPDFQQGSVVKVATGIANGTVTAEPKTGAIGDTVTVTATPALHYTLGAILVDGEELPESAYTSTTEATFAISKDKHTVSATFVEDHKATVSVVQPANGTVTLSAEGIIYVDEVVTIEAVPNGGYVVEDIFVNDVSKGKDYTSFVIEEGVDAYVVTATFKQDDTEYEVKADTTVANGTVKVSVEGGPELDEVKALSGTPIFVTPTPVDNTFVVGKVMVKTDDGEPVEIEPDENGKYVFNVIPGAHEITATFLPLYTITVTNAKVSVDGGAPAASIEAKEGDKVTITPDAGYMLTSATVKTGAGDPVAITPVEGVYSFTVTGDATVTVTSAFAAVAGDVFFVPGTVKAGQVIEAYAIDSDTLSTGTKGDLFVPADTVVTAGQDTGRFWRVVANNVFQAVVEVGYGGDSTYTYKFGYHDVLRRVNDDGTIGLQNGMAHHFGAGCAFGFTEENLCGRDDPADKATESSRYADELGPYVKFDEATSVIIDLRSGVSDADKIDSLAELAASELVQASGSAGGEIGKPVVNTYSANAVRTGRTPASEYKKVAGTITAMIIVNG